MTVQNSIEVHLPRTSEQDVLALAETERAGRDAGGFVYSDVLFDMLS